MDKQVEEKVRELQMLEQNLGNINYQKQTFQLELNEITSASTELESSEGDVFKVVGNVMIKSTKEKLKAELDERKNLVDLRLKNIEKQDSALRERVEELRKDVLANMK